MTAETSTAPASTAPAAAAPAPIANAPSASTPQPAAAPGQDSAAQPAKKLTGAELKAKKQAEKAARRAQAIQAKTEKAAAAPGGAVPPGGASQAGGANKGGAKPKGKPEAGGGKPAARRPSGVGAKPTVVIPAPPKEKDPRDLIPECFSHLPMAKRIPLSQADKDVHPVVLAVGQQMATFTLRDNIRRLEATLNAFKKVLESYEAPPSSAFSRHFVPHVLNPQIEYLTECRPMCFAMGNAIRLLKARISKLDPDTSDEEAIKTLCESIEGFIQERIYYAEVIIARNAADMIIQGDHILTYGGARLVGKALEQAWADGKTFEVAILDDPCDRTGQAMAKSLRQQGIRVSYYPQLGGVSCHLQHATKVMIGAEAVFANGSLYGPAGTSDVALAAQAANLPVIALCETINFDRERVATDSGMYNEIDPERCTEESFRLLFDTTRDKFLNVVVTEYETITGDAPATAILAILRKQEDPN